MRPVAASIRPGTADRLGLRLPGPRRLFLRRDVPIAPEVLERLKAAIAHPGRVEVIELASDMQVYPAPDAADFLPFKGYDHESGYEIADMGIGWVRAMPTAKKQRWWRR